MHLSGCLMAERGSRAREQDGRPELGMAREVAREGGVDPWMNLAPAAARDPEFDHAVSDAGLPGLRAGDHPVLIPGQIAESRRKLTFHSEQCVHRHRHSRRMRLYWGRFKLWGNSSAL